MSLLTAHLISGVLLIALGLPLLLNHSGYAAALKAFPRSSLAANIFFVIGAGWFLYGISRLGEADLIIPKPYMFGGFAVLAALSLIYMREFLSVRGLSIIILMGATPLLGAAYMEYDKPRRLFMVTAIYLAIAAAVWLGAQPWRLRDFLGWLFARPGRTRVIGGTLAGYGLLLALVAFTY